MARIYKSEDRVIFGVCGGLADHFGIAPLWIRIGWALAFIFFGLGLLLYLLAAFLMPSRG